MLLGMKRSVRPASLPGVAISPGEARLHLFCCSINPTNGWRPLALVTKAQPSAIALQ
jgi:hypothetical protein